MPRLRRHRTPTILQMESVECGAAALAIVLAHHGRTVSLEELRVACGVSRDGAKAVNIVRAARTYGLVAKGYRMEARAELEQAPLPAILFWDFRHFLVLESFGRDRVFLNDPATGPRTVSDAEFDRSFTGIVLVLEPGPSFERHPAPSGTLAALRPRLRGSATALAFVVLVSLALIVPGLTAAGLARIFVDEVLSGQRGEWLLPLALGLALAALFRGALTWMQQHYLLRLEMKLALTSSARFFRHFLRLPVVFFNQRHAGEIGGRVALNDQLAQLLSGQLATALLGVLLIGFYGFALAWISLPLAALGFAIAAANLAILWFAGRHRKDAHARLLQERGKLAGVTAAGLQSIETLKAGGAESDFFTRWAGHQAKALNAEQRFGLVTHLLNAAPPFLAAVNHAALLGAGGLMVMQDRLTLGALVAFQSLMASFLEPVNQLVRLDGALQAVDGNVKRLDDVLRHPADAQITRAENPPPAIFAAAAAASVPRIIKLSGRLELRHVTFGYSRLDPPLIEDFSLTLRPGQRVALVGPTGCGKSTLSRLVCGLHAPWSGEILFDGKPRAAVSRAVLAQSLALVDQDIFLFEGTARENLALWDATAPDAAVVAAAKDACIHEVIAGRPGGYDGRVDEGGRNFSGGQRQRLEIARALVNQPTLLVLDEATSALDAQTEHRIDGHLRRRGCACLIIAHRLSTIRDCDEIVVLDRGRIAQRGTHEQLVAQPGLYAELVAEN